MTVLYLSTNPTVDATDVVLGNHQVGPLAGGATVTTSTTVTLPSATATGTYYILAQADGTSMVVEASESNNVRFSSAIRIKPYDLTVSALTAPTTAGAGAAIVVTDTTQNAGGGTAPASSTAFYLSANVMLDAADVLLGSRGVLALAPGASTGASTTVAIPITVATGSYYVLALADGMLAVAETMESNNSRFAGPIQIGPDLVVSALTASAARRRRSHHRERHDAESRRGSRGGFSDDVLSVGQPDY